MDDYFSRTGDGLLQDETAEWGWVVNIITPRVASEFVKQFVLVLTFSIGLKAVFWSFHQ